MGCKCRNQGRAAMFRKTAWGLLALLLSVPVAAAAANVITDWEEKAVGIVQTKMPPPAGSRIMAMLHLAMFEAVNSIEPRYKLYKAKLAATLDPSKEAAPDAAAGMGVDMVEPRAAAQ